MANRKLLNKVLLAIVAILIGTVMIIPVYILVKVSFSDPGEILTQHPTLLPHSFTLEHWQEVLASGNLWEPLKKSLIVATSTTVISILVVSPAAYSIARMSRKVKYIFIITLFLTKMFPVVGIALPISITFLKWNLLDTNLGLILANLIGQIPFMAWILVSTFSSLPVDLEEAAPSTAAINCRS